MTTLVLVTDEKEIIECQDNLENVLKSQLNQEEEFSFGFQGGNFSNAANHNNSLWYSTFVDDKAKIPRFWNGFGLCENLNGNNAHISLEINIPKNASRQVNGAFVKDNGNVALIHRGRLNPGGSKFLDWYRENFPEYVKTISDGEKGAEVIIVGMLSDNDFIQQLENFIRRVISFKNWFRSGDMSDSNIQDVEIDSEVGSEAGINYRHLIKKNVLDGWYKITIEKNLWDSWSFPPDKKTICYALVDSNSLVTLYKGQINANNVIDYANVELSSLESNAIFNIVNSIISDPITARKKLDDGDVVPHVGHMNPIYLTVERYNNPDFTDGTMVLSWECDAMFVENGLLEEIIKCMKVSD